MGQHTNRLRTFDNGQTQVYSKQISVNFDVHERVVHLSDEVRLEEAEHTGVVPPEEMIFKYLHNVYVLVTTAGKQERVQVSRSSSDLPPSPESLELIGGIIKLLTEYKEKYV
jgi:hypothetical protein